MRILASNPDTIGDMVLRQPLYRALQAAGHELTLIVRPSVEPVVPLVAPGAGVLVLPAEVYDRVDDHWADFAPLVRSAVDAAPDLLLVAPFQWTRFEENLADALRAALPRLTVAGMSGRLFPGDPFQGPAAPSTLRLDRAAAADEDLPEAEKNAALAEMLGCPVASVDPVLTPDDQAMQEARRALADRGLEPGGYWVACVTGTQHVPIKAWPADRWADVLRQWHERHGRRFLFVGLSAERPVVDQVRVGMGPEAAAASAVWMEPGASVATLAALASLSQGYVGHDTGPMHLAAAVGKPVVAVFGGGHKLRFLPRATPSVSVSVRVPCAGCGWACSFDKAHCVQALTVEDVLAAVEDVEAGRVDGRLKSRDREGAGESNDAGRTIDPEGQSLGEPVSTFIPRPPVEQNHSTPPLPHGRGSLNATASGTIEPADPVALPAAVPGREARLLPLSADLHDHMTAFAADLARRRLREAAALAADHGIDLTGLRADRDAHARRAQMLAGRAAAADEQARRLEQGIAAVTAEAAGLLKQLADRERAATELRAAVAAADARTSAEAEARRREADELRRAADAARERAAAEADARRHEVETLRQSTEQAHRLAAAEADARKAEVDALTMQLGLARREAEALKQRVEALAPKPAAASPSTSAAPPAPTPVPTEPARPRKTWRERAVDLVCGTRTYAPRTTPRPMPKILVVTRLPARLVGAADESAARATIDSVLAERYPHLEYVLVAGGAEGEGADHVGGDVAAPGSSPLPPGEVAASAAGEGERRVAPGQEPSGSPSVIDSATPSDPDEQDAARRSPSPAAEAATSPGGRGEGADAPSGGDAIVSRAVLASLVDEYRDRVTKVVPAQATPFGAVADAFADSDADLVAWLDVGQSYEPGALMRAGEFFRDHPLAFAAAFGQTIEADGGWRFPVPRLRLDVESLRLRDDQRIGPSVAADAHVVYRRSQYALLGPLDAGKGYAAGWDLLVRFARRYGVRHGRGQSVCVGRPVPALSAAPRDPMDDLREQEDWLAAGKAFEASYGTAGRLRCGVLHVLGELRAAAGLRLAWRRRVWLWPHFLRTDGSGPAPTEPLATPVSPLSHRRPDRLLFAGPDVTTGDPTVFRAYYDAVGDVAVAFPPVDGPTFQRLHVERAKLARSPVVPLAGWTLPRSGPSGQVVPPSPFAGYRGGPAWARRLADLPSPYWRLARVRPGGESDAARLVSLARSAARPDDAAVRCLIVGCYDGAILDDLKAVTTWQLTGLETNADAAAVAKAKGYAVWPCSPQDAFMTLPDGEVFDVILVPAMLEHWDDPAWVLRRLTRLLTPAGAIVVRTPNLDSRLLDLFGPTWWHWQLPYHRTLLGRRGLRNLAKMCALRVAKMRTVTDAYAAAASVQLNAVGLAGVVPEGAAFDPAVSAKGAKLAGWARLLWDRWGRGDEMWAALRPL